MKTLVIDYENNAEGFWDAVRETVRGDALSPAAREAITALASYGEPSDLEVPDAVAAEVEAWFSTLPGWSDPGAPAHAPRPVVIAPAAEENGRA